MLYFLEEFKHAMPCNDYISNSGFCPWPWQGIEWVKTRARVCEWLPFVGANMFWPTPKQASLPLQIALLPLFHVLRSRGNSVAPAHLFSRVTFELRDWSQECKLKPRTLCHCHFQIETYITQGWLFFICLICQSHCQIESYTTQGWLYNKNQGHISLVG